MSPKRVAIVGAGIGAQHLEGILANRGAFTPQVVCDLDPARAEALRALAPELALETDLAAVLARDDVDIVDICLPPMLHVPAMLQALAAGKDVICEKPLTGSLAEVDRIRAAAAEAGRLVVPVYQYRFGNGLRRLQHLLAQDLPGKPLVATVETHWDRRAPYYAVPWRGKKATELGGALLGHAIHAHDLLTTLLGPVRRVFARTATAVNPIETEDCAAACLEMTSGALVTLSVTLGSAEEITRLRFCFADLTAESALTPSRPAVEPWRLLPRGDGVAAKVDLALESFEPRQEGFAGLFEALGAHYAGSAPPPVTLEDAHRSLALVTAMYYSAATGTPVELPLARDHPAYSGWLPWLTV